MQFILTGAALLSIFAAVKAGRSWSKTVSVILGLLWLWMGAVYHLMFFSLINPAATVFGIMFILQAAIFFYAGALRDDLTFRFRPCVLGFAGILLLIYALVAYPLLGFVYGHVYPYSPTFGLPCPTVIFTFALLLWSDKKVPLYVLPIPLIWSLIGFSAAILLGICEDIGLLIAGVLAVSLLLWSRRKEQPASR